MNCLKMFALLEIGKFSECGNREKNTQIQSNERVLDAIFKFLASQCDVCL